MNWRYQRQSLYAERGNVLTYEGIDPLTGLPVLIYSFSGTLDPALRNLESENIPGLLAVITEGELTQVAVAYSREYQPLLSPPQIATHTLLLDSARALRDAAEAGVLHGDIRPLRFLASPSHLLFEGFGIPWRPDDTSHRAPELTNGASYAGDIYAWAKSLFELNLTLSSRQKRVLEACLHQDPNERPTAGELYTTLEAEPSEAISPKLTADTLELTFDEEVMGEGSIGSSASPEFVSLGLDLEAQPQEASIPLDDTDDELEGDEDAPVIVKRNTTEPSFDIDDFDDAPTMGAVFTAPAEASEPDPLVIMSDPGKRAVVPSPVTVSKSPKASEGGFVKTLPPGATYRPGATIHDAPPGKFKEPKSKPEKKAAQPRHLRNLLRFVAILMVAAAVAVLVFLQRQQTQPTASTPGGASVANYIVEVTIEPANLPPVGLYVVSAPEGTRTPAGAQVGSYQPGRNQIVLDRPGNWQFQVRFEDRASDVVALRLPEERSLRFTLAPPTEPEEESAP